MVSQCCGESREIERGCKKRWCPVCAGKIALARINKYQFAAKKMRWPMAVTLTQENSPVIKGTIKHLRQSMLKLRRMELWKKSVVGGLVSIEVTNLSQEERKKRKLSRLDPTGWHAHAHLLIDCQWLAVKTPYPHSWLPTAEKKRLYKAAHAELSERWAFVLRQEHAVTWVERAYDKALLETLKYCVKVMDLLQCAQPIGPLLREMHRIKMVNGFGTMFGIGKKMNEELEELKTVCKCDRCGEESEWRLAANVEIIRNADLPLYSAKQISREAKQQHAKFCDGIPY